MSEFEQAKPIRYWWVQKSTVHNCPEEINGAVFEEFAPTVAKRGCEWVKVYSADDLQKSIGMGVNRYSQVCAELHQAKEHAEKLAALYHEAIPALNHFGQSVSLVQDMKKALAEYRQAFPKE